jgi:peptidyl-prolyl cis-trans isomerase B (cyclophilin B)
LPSKKRRRRAPVQHFPSRKKAKPPFPINVIFNVKAFYVFFIVIMIASLGAVGFGAGFGSSAPPPILDDELEPEATPATMVFDGPVPTIDTSVPHVAVIQTDQGEIEIELSTEAPAAVNSFAFLAAKGFYEGAAFFYVDQDFFAQVGDPTCAIDSETVCSGVGGPGYTLPLEETDLGHEPWTVVAPAIAEGGQEVHGSQFRILFDEDPRLDGVETVFGRVIRGQDILSAVGNFAPCSIVTTEDCAEDLSGTIIIESVTIQPAA